MGRRLAGADMSHPLHRRALAGGLLSLGAAAALAPIAGAQGEPGLIVRRESRYNTIYIRREPGGLISMQFGVNERRFTESLYNPADPRELPVAYTRYMTVALLYPPRLNNVLEIGLGGGRTANYLHLHMPELTITSVELDPDVIALARRYFGVTPNARFRVEEADGRMYLRRTNAQYDLIMVDAYRGTFVPFHLLTREFFETVKSRLAPGGAVAQNIEPCTMLYESAINTLKAVFDHVDVYNSGGNVVAVAYDGEIPTQAQFRRRARQLQAAHNFRHPIEPMIEIRRIANRLRGASVLTDDFAPVESLNATERHNARQPSARGTGRC